ncbi:hypothetical protein CEXT_286181 [Caerostris extrusa]|uniref:Uncharacterized protein n=1 Tax=Caerostris extrusa TaxID=172846 RepID=A0AAV4VKQ9_CAEEX|nr:hypothetical protein CEXT_286181 [Caerostris extrusa]
MYSSSEFNKPHDNVCCHHVGTLKNLDSTALEDPSIAALKLSEVSSDCPTGSRSPSLKKRGDCDGECKRVYSHRVFRSTTWSEGRRP